MQSLKKLFECFCDFGILVLDEEEKNTFLKLVEIRDDVHIRLMRKRAYFEDDYSLERYNQTVSLMKKMNEQLFDNLPKYCDCDRYQAKNEASD